MLANRELRESYREEIVETTTTSLLTIDRAAEGIKPAVRIDPPEIVTTTTIETGLWGMPFAPEGLSDCDEFKWYRAQWGGPVGFDRLAWRESNCRNEDGVKTWCCHGYLQLYVSEHLKDHRMIPLYHACGVYSHEDINSDTPLEKQKHLCAAVALWSVDKSAWDL